MLLIAQKLSEILQSLDIRNIFQANAEFFHVLRQGQGLVEFVLFQHGLDCIFGLPESVLEVLPTIGSYTVVHYIIYIRLSTTTSHKILQITLTSESTYRKS